MTSSSIQTTKAAEAAVRAIMMSAMAVAITSIRVVIVTTIPDSVTLPFSLLSLGYIWQLTLTFQQDAHPRKSPNKWSLSIRYGANLQRSTA